MDRETAIAGTFRFLGFALPAGVLLFLLLAPQRFEALPNHLRLLVFVPVPLGVTLWHVSSSGPGHKVKAIGGAVSTLLVLVGAACWYVLAPQARA